MKQFALLAIAASLLAPVTTLNAQAPPPSGPPGGVPAGARAGGMAMGDKLADAKPGDVRVFATGSIQGSLLSVRAEADKAVGKHLVMEFGTARGSLREQILGGQDFEVAILVEDVNDELIQKGLARSQRYGIATIPVGVGYTGDGPLPDISTAAALKKVLLGAKQVTYAPQGMGAQTANKAIDGLGIRNSIKISAAAGPGGPGGPPPGVPGGQGPGGPPPGVPGGPGVPGAGAGPAPAALAGGEYIISILPASEILANKNTKYLGPVVDEYQVAQVLQAVIGTKARDEKSAKAFLDYLHSPEFGAVLSRNGFVQSK